MAVSRTTSQAQLGDPNFSETAQMANKKTQTSSFDHRSIRSFTRNSAGLALKAVCTEFCPKCIALMPVLLHPSTPA